MDAEALKALLQRAGQYTAKYEKSAHEVEEKLLKWSDDEILPSEIQYIIKRLKEDKFIDEERYAERYIRDKLVMLKKGPFLIRQELKERGIQSSVIQRALDAIPYDDWFVALESYMRPRVARHKEKAKNDYDFQRRLVDMAYRRGYSSDIYEEVIDKIIQEMCDD